jgi:Flp pilus assembly pilin Flp
MKAQVISTTEYTGICPVQPWQHVVSASQGSAAEAGDAVAAVARDAAATPRKASDRGASAVEWVVITGIVVAIVAGVGWGISKAISSKADDACNKIATAGNGDPAGGNGGTTGGTTGGTGCAK